MRAGLWSIRRRRRRGRGRNFSCLPVRWGPAPIGRAAAQSGRAAGVGTLPWLIQGCARATAPRGRVSSLRAAGCFCGKRIVSPRRERKPPFWGVNPPFHTPLPTPGRTVGVWGKIPAAPVYFSPACSSSWSGRAQPPAPFQKGRDIYSCLAQGVGICHGCLHPPHPAAASFSCVLPWSGGQGSGPIQPWPWGQLWGSLCDAQGLWCISV